jgi:hypothetical protein
MRFWQALRASLVQRTVMTTPPNRAMTRKHKVLEPFFFTETLLMSQMEAHVYMLSVLCGLGRRGIHKVPAKQQKQQQARKTQLLELSESEVSFCLNGGSSHGCEDVIVDACHGIVA